MRARFGIDAETGDAGGADQGPAAAEIDLLWFGGIGTYVKATDETHAEVGDRANDALRVDRRELRAKVVGEGANLGVTQRGRIEYAQMARRQEHQHRRASTIPPASTPPTTRSTSRSCSAKRCRPAT